MKHLSTWCIYAIQVGNTQCVLLCAGVSPHYAELLQFTLRAPLFPCFLPSLSALLERMQKNWSPALWHSFLLWRGFNPHGGRSHSGGIKCPTLVSPNRAHNWQRVRLSWTFACSALCNLWCYVLKLHATNGNLRKEQVFQRILSKK